MNPAHNPRSGSRAGLPDRRLHAFAVRWSLLVTLFLVVSQRIDWDSEFWPLVLSPFYLLVTYLIGRFIAAERYTKQDKRTALASQAFDDAGLARDAARQAEASARDAETAAHDTHRIAQERPIASDAARNAAAGAVHARNAAKRAGALADGASDDANAARSATKVDRAARAAEQAALARHEAVVAAEDAATHAMTARQALEEARSAVAHEGDNYEDLVKALATGVEFLGFLPGVDPTRKDAICQNVAREFLPVAISLRNPHTRRLAAQDGAVQGLLATIDARLTAQNLDLPQAQLIFDALGYGRANQRPLS